MKAIFLTDKGKVRPHNEDCGGILKNQDGQVLAIVADGMGGHRAGDVASRMTVEKLKHAWEKSSSLSTPNKAESWLKEQIEMVNRELYEHAKAHDECQGMGTTIVAFLSFETFATISHIGDSRCYLLNGSGFKQITEDHSLVNELLKSGQISKEDAEQHPRKNILLRALGTEPSVQIDMKTIGIDPGDVIMLCSDGLSNKVSEEELKEILSSHEPLEIRAEKLITRANVKGGEDNISVVLYEHALLETGDDPC
ncbi:Stp1/IreP family PP2C-type Ser/Thr phosphatase [Bacillus sp. FJAT-47783]|uniref:Stp1/IreP family PP2C-type Ser/Thr phosphatase n=1 Tax=Bacillus sp. FJAT-47783 TaxID=2922712 RepID=UPI001FAC8C8E|nr:Stp1/IreP family PP2C-type Ser/Thr phosphatase [Bacillus sp. FJAT-47783]